MTDEQRQEIMQWQNEGMRAISDAYLRYRLQELANAQLDPSLSIRGQEGSRNLWGATSDAQNNIAPDLTNPTMWARIKQWMKK